MKMIDLKQPQGQTEPEASPAEKDLYPWGLSLSLGTDVAAQLSFPADAAIGQEFPVHAIAKVVSLSAEETTQGEERFVRLQITQMAGFGPEGPTAAEALYGKPSQDAGSTE